MKTIYLSGPMSGHPDHNHPAFHAEADRLRAHGYQVINPAEINVEGGAWHDCLRADIRALMDCDTIALLPGWEASQGAHLELHIAHRVGMRVVMAADVKKGLDWCCENGCGPCTPKLADFEYYRSEDMSGRVLSSLTQKVWVSKCCGADLALWDEQQKAFLDDSHPVNPPRNEPPEIGDACLWIENNEAIWNTACGEAWSFVDGGPADNNVKFCHGCGKPVLAVPCMANEEASA